VKVSLFFDVQAADFWGSGLAADTSDGDLRGVERPGALLRMDDADEDVVGWLEVDASGTAGTGEVWSSSVMTVSPSAAGILPLFLIVRGRRLIICKPPPRVGPVAFGHLRWGQLPSAGPRQKKGVGGGFADR
jgi:hypothetical protein